ncbi:Oidioi.mRNA.OKI2018_I69.chr1.g194.t1.cds [Oikopleura dioica]|uniref:Oidioi.mRNA.OKI2018_I69.chr1.g194.t1.cds n=1 Tax=Oikopleura dioica TaxID=34765 RepID=A0ABN7SKT8_OIKDI|nr:Oidioi.mRNA.OKI2018_I69.chr1.g194.t1.cds [Oikopleura dioica]
MTYAYDEENRILYLSKHATENYLDIQLDFDVYVTAFIITASLLFFAIACLLMHCPIAIEKFFCHTDLNCFRWMSWICSCCPRDYFISYCRSCRKSPNRKVDYRHLRHSDNGNEDFNQPQRSRMIIKCPPPSNYTELAQI